MQTKDPTFEPEYGFRAEVDNGGGRRLAGFASGPIVEDQLAFRLTADAIRDEVDLDFGESIASDDIFDDPERIEQMVFRGKLLFEPEALPGLSTQLTASYTDVRRPSNELVVPPFEDRIARDFTIGPRTDVETISGNFDLSYDFGSGLEISNRLTYADFETKIRRPDQPAPGFFTTSLDGNQLTNETLLRFDLADTRLSGLTGLYVSRKDQDEFPVVFGPGAAIEDEQTSLGVFAELTYSVTDRLEVTGGLRYQRDSQERNGQAGFLDVDFDETFDAILPKADISYALTDNTRVGFTVARGFNPGGITLNFNTFETVRFDEETVWNYELYARSRLLDDRLNLAVNLFFSDFDGFQNAVVDGFTPTGDPQFVIGNADATTKGLEVSADFEATEWLTVFGSLGLLDTEFDQLTAPGVSEELEFSYAPDVTAFIGADFRPVDGWTVSAQIRHSSAYFSDDDNTVENEVSGFTVLDLSARYEVLDGVAVYGFVSNLLDDDYVVYKQNAGQEATLSEERTVGLGLSLSF
ncbi:TonB-dependent receptor [Pelagibius sp.]|uniref:TonB-dependent receptor n=1 Tax=Pelagibius sp. TaxID=1931238 RepID=UPI003BAFB340